jgi:hypothetical protein
MLNGTDYEQIEIDLLVIRDDDPVSLVIRRGIYTLPMQTARVVKTSSARRMQSATASEVRAGMIVLGDPTLDIAVDDRFTLSGTVYRVTFIRPNRISATMADAEIVE